MEQDAVALTIVGMALVTYLPRLLPMLLLTRHRRSGSTMSPLVTSWLRHVPPAVLAAMLLPLLLAPDRHAEFTPGNLYLWAAVPTLLAAWKTRSLIGSVIVGVAVVALGRLIAG